MGWEGLKKKAPEEGTRHEALGGKE